MGFINTRGVMLALRAQLARAVVGSALLLLLAGCVPICGIGSHLKLTNARVDASYTCPYPSSNRGYDLHGTIDVDNYTNNSVAIRSLSETNVTFAIHGGWTGPLNEKGGGNITNYSPKSIAAGDKTTVHFVIPFQCTNSGPGADTYGDFSFKYKVVTTAGTFNLDGADTHRLKMQRAP